MIATRIRLGCLAAIFLAQVAGIVRARFVRDRYFAWAPLHEVSELRIEIVEHGHGASFDTMCRRYAIPSSARANGIVRELNDADPLLERIRRIECARPRPGRVVIRGLRNGAPYSETIACR